MTDDTPRGTETILLVDDNAAARSGVERLLAALGYSVLPAGLAVEARELMRDREGDVDLALVDLILPDVLGTTLAADLLRDYPYLRVLFVSGYSDLGPVADLPKDRYGFLAKPFSMRALATAVREVLDRRPSSA